MMLFAQEYQLKNVPLSAALPRMYVTTISDYLGGDDRYTVPKQAQGIGTKHIAKAQVEMQQGGTNRPEIVMANPDSDRPSKRTVHRLRLF